MVNSNAAVWRDWVEQGQRDKEMRRQWVINLFGGNIKTLCEEKGKVKTFDKLGQKGKGREIYILRAGDENGGTRRRGKETKVRGQELAVRHIAESEKAPR